jgi:hypothetical protein
MPDFNAADLEWLYQRQGAEPGICLATITGPEFPGVTRLARNTEDITSRGNVYKAAWFDVVEPSDNDEQPVTRFTVPNVDGEVGHALLEAGSGLVVHFEWVRPADYDHVIDNLRSLKLRNCRIDALEVSGELSPVQYDTEPYIFTRVSPSAFPGLYRMRS